MRRLNATRDAARAIVRAGTESTEVAIYETPEAPPPWRPEFDARPCRLLSAWTQNDAGVWQGRACFIVPETGRSDPSFTFDVYCPAASGRPEGDPGFWSFWAAWRGRWESLQQPVYRRIYVGGDYISAGGYDSALGGYRIDNEGLTNAVTPGDSYSNTHTLYFHSRFFRWIPSTLDIVGKKELSLVGRYETVLTPDGQKQIFALGPAS